MTGTRHPRHPRHPCRAGAPEGVVGDAFVRELHALLSNLVERAPLFADLRSRGLAEDLVQETLITITRRIERGQHIDDPFSYAVRCVENLAKRSYIRGPRETAVGDDTLERLAPVIEDVADRVERRMAMGEVLDMVRAVNAVIADLEPLELELVRAELARTDQKQLAARLGISRPTLYRRKRPAVGAFVAAVAARAGTRPCPEHAGALLAAAGDSGFDGARAAAAHAATCEQCGETIRHLAVARHGLAIIAPIPLAAGSPDPVRLLERAHASLDTVLDTVRTLVLRVGDPTPLGGSAAKTVAIVAAACTGGGGIYCAVDGVPSQLGAPFAHHRADDGTPRRRAVRDTARVPAGTLVPAAQAVRRLSSTVRTVGDQETARRRAREARAARAAARRRAERDAARRRRAQAAREFAARTAPALPATQEFATPQAAPASTITRREFGAPATGGSGTGAATQTQQEFGAP